MDSTDGDADTKPPENVIRNLSEHILYLLL